MDRGVESTRPTVADGGTGPTAPGARVAPGDAAARYELVRELGRGAMGAVWLARDRSLDREVAVKLLHDRLLSAVHQQRMAVEARAMARLSHPNVVAIYDVGEREGRTFIAMELVRGEPLSAWVKAPRPWREVVRVFRGVGAGLAAAHASGLVHRDVKPSNILVGDDGRPRLADFGVAHVSVVAGEPASTSTGTAGPIGSPAYMPPERLSGDAAGARGDQFAFCAAFYEVLHGRRPFLGATSDEIVRAIHRGPPPPVRPVPRWLHAVIARGLAADAAARFASMDELLAALRAGPRRGVAIAAVVGLAVVAAIALVIALARGPDGSKPPAVAQPAITPPPPPPPIDAAPAPVDAPPPPVDAPPPPVDAAPAARAKPPEPDPARDLTVEEARTRYRALRAQMKSASDAGELREARAFAEQMIPFGRRLGTHEPYQVVMVLSCRLGDERRARQAFAKLPRNQRFVRTEMLDFCSRHGMSLDDLEP